MSGPRAPPVVRVMYLHWAGAKVQPCFKESLVMKSEVPNRQFFNEWRLNVCWIFNFDSLSYLFTLSISKGNPTPGPAVYCRGLMMNPFWTSRHRHITSYLELSEQPIISSNERVGKTDAELQRQTPAHWLAQRSGKWFVTREAITSAVPASLQPITFPAHRAA